MEKIKLILFLTLLCSCNTSEKKITKVERISLEAEIITDSIHASLPGSLIVFNDHLVWEDAHTSNNFLHVVDIKTRKELGRFGQKGSGPKEFITPFISKSSNDLIYVYDLNTKHQAYFSLNNFLKGQDYYVKIPDVNKIRMKYTTRIIEFDKNYFVALRPGGEFPLERWHNRSFYPFGTFPIKEGVCELDRMSFFSAEILYNPDNQRLVYSSFRFPYLAIYKNDGKYFKLENESSRDFEYSVSGGRLDFDRSRTGISALALIKDYIVTVERDYEKDQTNERTVGMDPMKLTRTVFLYNYDGQLMKIVDLGYPILRIAADTKNNTLYAIVVMDDYVLVKYELK